MNYLEKWADTHIKRVLTELKQENISLTLQNIPQIIEATSFRRRSVREPEECPCYENGKPCHPEVKDLNCFLCACPDYLQIPQGLSGQDLESQRILDSLNQNQKLQGGCEINCELGKWYKNHNLQKGKIWDCSDCAVPHFPSYVQDYLKKNMDKLRAISDEL